jgi:hypothetical protein
MRTWLRDREPRASRGFKTSGRPPVGGLLIAKDEEQRESQAFVEAVMDTWNPAQYEKFGREREQPFFDLLALVQPGPDMQVVDLGCGTGTTWSSRTPRCTGWATTHRSSRSWWGR